PIVAQQIVHGLDRARHAVALGHARRLLLVAIAKSDQLHALALLEHRDVIHLRRRTHADHRDPDDFLRHAFPPPTRPLPSTSPRGTRRRSPPAARPSRLSLAARPRRPAPGRAG